MSFTQYICSLEHCTPTKATKKATKTKFARPNGKKETHASWKNNYKIVKDMCTIIAQKVVLAEEDESSLLEESGDNDRLPWSEFVGIKTHNCKYLRSGKKVTSAELFFSATGSTDKQAAEAVAKFVSYTKHNQHRLPEWKINLLNELEFDILKK